MNKQLVLQSFKLKKDLHLPLWVLEMPEQWLEGFKNIFFDDKLNRKYLKTKELKKIIYSLDRHIVYVGDFFTYPFDKVWLVATKPIDDELIAAAFKGWCQSIKKELLPDRKEKFINWQKGLQLSEVGAFEERIFNLTDERGYIDDSKAYDILPNLIRHMICDKSLCINDREIPFAIAEEKKVISKPTILYLEGTKHKHYFSYSIQFNIQTTPHAREPMLVYRPVITRWISRQVKDYPLQKNNLSVYVSLQDEILYPIKLIHDEDNGYQWESLATEVLRSVNGSVKIPDADAYAKDLVPYIDGETKMVSVVNMAMGGGISSVKVGVPMKDKEDIYESLRHSLERYIEIQACKVEQFSLQLGKMPAKLAEGEIFRQQMAQAIGSKKLTIEIYSEGNEALMQQIKEQIEVDFALLEGCACNSLEIEVLQIDARPLGILKPLEEKKKALERHELRLKEIQEVVQTSTEVIGSIVILPYLDENGKEVYKKNQDPKKAIRAGLATTGRLSQFMDPIEKEDRSYRIKVALQDLYRQLGYVNYGTTKAKKVAKLDNPISGLHIINFKKTPYGHLNRIPVLVTCSKEKGQVHVECPSLWSGKILYREACLQFQRLATKQGYATAKSINPLVQIKQMITQLFHLSKKPHLLLMISDGTTRNVWKLLTDSALGSAERIGDYALKNLWFDKDKMEESIHTEKISSELRIMRVRHNGEVPEYITARREDSPHAFESTSGMFKGDYIFYGIASRLQEKPFTNTFQGYSKIEMPNAECKVPDMIEIYPIYLKETDDAKEWATLVNKYREGAHQYKWLLRSPLPLHLGEKLEEYIG